MKVQKVGIEIEGAFKRTFEDVQIIHDGSICTKLPPGVKKKGWHLGEVVSKVLSPGKAGGWIQEHYPDSMNHLCGLHVHLSFDDNERAMAFLSYGKFYAFFLEEMEKWGLLEKLPPEHEFWTRLSGNNEYCKKAFVPSIQTKRHNKEGTPHLPVRGGGDRYCQLNFCYRLHGTVEARLLPVFEKVDLSVRGVEKIIWIFNEWLARDAPEDMHLRVSLREGRRPRKVASEGRRHFLSPPPLPLLVKKAPLGGFFSTPNLQNTPPSPIGGGVMDWYQGLLESAAAPQWLYEDVSIPMDFPTPALPS